MPPLAPHRAPAHARTTPAATPRRAGRGGARAGAGRPARHAIASEPHKTRPALSARHPVHVTARVTRAVGTLRRRHAYRALERALRTSLARTDFRIIRLAVRPTCVELLVEADDKAALARAMQGFQVAAARHLNRALGRSGGVFPDRYRAAILRTRQAVRATLARIPTRHTPAGTAAARGPAPQTWPETWLLRVELARPHARGSP